MRCFEGGFSFGDGCEAFESLHDPREKCVAPTLRAFKSLRWHRFDGHFVACAMRLFEGNGIARVEFAAKRLPVNSGGHTMPQSVHVSAIIWPQTLVRTSNRLRDNRQQNGNGFPERELIH